MADTASPLARSFLDKCSGEWAGWQCDFSPADGRLQPVPDKYLSQTMIDYEQQPAGFQLLCTESESPGTCITRRFLQILPEEGCALDDLPARVSTSTLTLPRLCGSADGTAFALDDPPEADNPAHGAWYLRSWFVAAASRVRVSVRFDPLSQKLVASKPVRIASERHWAEAGALDSELRLRDMGGAWHTGLDAAFVSKAVSATCFAAGGGSGGGAPAEAPGALLHLDLPLSVRVRVAPRPGGEAGCSLEVSARAAGRGADERAAVRRDFDPDGRLVATSVLGSEEKEDGHRAQL